MYSYGVNLYIFFHAGCGKELPADIIFALPPKISAEESAKASSFIEEVSMDFDIGSDKVRMALVPQECQALKGFPFRAAKSHNDIVKLLAPSRVKRSTTADVLHYMQRAVRISNHHRRSSGDMAAPVKKIGVVFIDCTSPHLSRTAAEALKAKKLADLELFVVVVGQPKEDKVMEEAKAIASGPASTHVLSVGSYNDLQSVKDLLALQINQACNSKFNM